jgi:PAS domain S-box-containing protein
MIMFASQSHQQGFQHHVRSSGHDVERLCQTGQLILFDAAETLTQFMVHDSPNPNLFMFHIGNTIDSLRKSSFNGHVRAYSELVDLLWKQGRPLATIALESFWNEICAEHPLSLLCGYFLNAVSPEDNKPVSGLHSNAITWGREFDNIRIPHENADEIALLRRQTAALEDEVAHRKRLEIALRQSLSERVRAEKALQASQQELADFIENAADGFHWLSADGVILAANQAELNLLGYSSEEYVGHSITEFHLDPEVAADILARIQRNEPIRAFEVRLRAKDGTIKHLLVHLSTLFQNGEFVHSRCLTRDITDRKKLEDELRLENEDYLRTVRFSEKFVGILGHDLRNPLSAITTGASLLKRRGESEKVVKIANRILNSAGRMGRMIDQVLDFTRIRLGQGIPIQPRHADLMELCRLAMDEFENTTPLRRIVMTSRGDTTGMWDAERLVQLVSNLLGNALTHGDPGLHVTVSCDGTLPALVRLDIHNTGTVPAELIPVLFEPFRSGLNAKQERSNGLGLGLFISQQIAIAHTGTIQVISSEENGTHLIVNLPRDAQTMLYGFKQGTLRGAS